ncbi:hypothetical protein TPA0909_08080 [Streptomyces albus]|nr:hypothetical protein TPA0909_08080 [Streptomyces albus]
MLGEWHPVGRLPLAGIPLAGPGGVRLARVPGVMASGKPLPVPGTDGTQRGGLRAGAALVLERWRPAGGGPRPGGQRRPAGGLRAGDRWRSVRRPLYRGGGRAGAVASGKTVSVPGAGTTPRDGPVPGRPPPRAGYANGR